MSYLVDLIAILLMGDGFAKILNPKSHNVFYQFNAMPAWYNRSLVAMAREPVLSILAGVGMLAVGALLNRWAERRFSDTTSAFT